MCREKSPRNPEGLRCRGLHRSPQWRAFYTAQLTLASKLEQHAASRSSAFGGGAEPPPEPGAPLMLSQKLLKALLASALVIQRQWAKVQEHRARVAVQRQEAVQARIQAEKDEHRDAGLQATSDDVEAAHVALGAAKAELFRVQLLVQDVTPTPGWPAPEIALEQQRSYASVEADDLGQATLELKDKLAGKPLTPRQARELRSLESKHTLTLRHRDRLAEELRALPTHAEALEVVTRAEAGVEAAEAIVKQAEGHFGIQ